MSSSLNQGNRDNQENREIPKITLTNGVEIPALGLGTAAIGSFTEDGPRIQACVETAIELGYRHFDTAAVYGNEAGVGAGLRASGLPPEELFVTTKVWNAEQGYDSTLKAFENSLKALGSDRVDLYLIHWPVEPFERVIETWRALERLYREKAVRAVGVSNFTVRHLKKLAKAGDGDENRIKPMINQVEFHPYLYQEELLHYCRAEGMPLEAWSPLGGGNWPGRKENPRPLEDPLVIRLAEKYGKTPAQILIAWSLHLGNIVIPKSENPRRLEENLAAGALRLSSEDREALSGLNRNFRYGADPDHVDF